jgi:Cys-tRNA synthase (O-phospho-L-seryl-tRNA:Cys-tRNA synthase)
MDLKTAISITREEYRILEIDDLKLREDERHKLMMRVVDVCEYGNLDDLKRLNKILEDNNFAKKGVNDTS